MNRLHLAAALIAVTVILSPAARSAAAEPVKLSESQLAQLEVKTVAPKPVTDVPLPGAPARVQVPPQAERVVAAPRAGLITEVRVAEGQSVKQGQVLGGIESPGVLALQRDYLDALSAYHLAKAQYTRDQDLFKDGIIAERRMQETEQAYREKQNALAAARQLLMGAGFTKTDISRLANTQRMSPILEVRAPIDGVVLKRMISPGERVNDQQPLYHIADISTLWLDISLPAEQLAGVRADLPVTVPGCAVPARVILVGAVVDPTNQTIMVRAALDKPCDLLRPGQVVQAQIYSHRDQPVLSVPQQAVVTNAGKDWVFVREGKGYAAQQVHLITRANDQAFIESGLDPKAQVAVTEIATLKAAWVGMGGE
ncbi:MAG: efflux RND transporter periplasmic adaptor subunit [Gammaproteobacteria bacterium]